MLLTVVSVFVGVLALTVLIVMATSKKGRPVSAEARLAALDRELGPTDEEEVVADIRRQPHRLTAIPWLDRWLTRINFASVSAVYMYQAGMTVTIGKLLVMSVAGSAILGFLLCLRFGPTLPALGLSTLFLPLPFLYVRHRRTKRLSKLEQQLPDALGMMASALRVGHSLMASLGAVADESQDPIAGEMRKCFDEQNYGIDLRTAFVNLTERVPIQDYRIFVAAVLIQKDSGGNLAEVLEKVAQTTRERFRLKKQVSVHTAQGRMTGWILSLLPALLGLGMYFVNPDGMSVLWKDPLGLKLLYTAIGMDIVGGLLIRKIVSIQV
jgi:tight adherence protein B